MELSLLSPAWIAEFLRVAGADRELGAIGNHADFAFVWSAGERDFFVRVVAGRPKEFRTPLTINDTWSFTLRASEATWRRFLAPVPKPLYQDIFAMATRVKDFHLDGDRLVLMQHARAVLRLMTLARGVGRPSQSYRSDPAPQEAGDEDVALEPISGRYLHLAFAQRRYRVYFEEAGEGPPLLLLHTAGADSRQYMHMLNDPAYRAQWRMIAFDMPYHGRSMPPDEWWKEQYRLSPDFHAEFIAAVARALSLTRPVVLGCSMAGKVALELAYRHPTQWRAVVACEATHLVNGRGVGWTSHPAVNAAECVPSWLDGLMAPTSPEVHRREVWWAYSQSGAGVFNGDIASYSRQWTTDERMRAIDSAQCPVYMLTGEYDFSCTPAATLATAACIPGAKVTVMKGLGHFPMAEHPARFKRYLLPVLREIRLTTPP